MTNNFLIRRFDSFKAAEDARNALLHSGFPAQDIELTANADEAGPVEGNFAIGNGNYDNPSYHGNFADVVHRSTYMLTVDTEDEQQLERASYILDQFSMEDRSEHVSKPDSVRRTYGA